jgi:hypothetical protein
MPHERWIAYLTYRLTRLRRRIHETERLLRPPTPEEAAALRRQLDRLKANEAKLTRLLTDPPPAE